MTDEKWQSTCNMIQDKFGISEHDSYIISDSGGGIAEYIIFNGPIGLLKIERYIRPVLLNKKTNYSRRPGADINVQYEYSETEKTYSFKVFAFNQACDDWQVMDKNMFE